MKQRKTVLGMTEDHENPALPKIKGDFSGRQNLL